MAVKYYVAYGSNTSIEQMKVRCPDAVPVGVTSLRDWRLMFRYHATIEREKGFEVPVVVWAISKADEANLDRYEGAPVYYRKQMIPVTFKAFDTRRTRKVSALVYVMNNVQQITPPDDWYLAGIEEGYEHFHLNRRVLQKAVDDSIYYYSRRVGNL